MALAGHPEHGTRMVNGETCVESTIRQTCFLNQASRYFFLARIYCFMYSIRRYRGRAIPTPLRVIRAVAPSAASREAPPLADGFAGGGETGFSIPVPSGDNEQPEDEDPRGWRLGAISAARRLLGRSFFLGNSEGAGSV